ncbi:hypothetical protein EV360DRAFT_56777 [Lentinula raphanica]|nr:hypothetical protein EV360DRAFT_56777 [Lentinula raphanica]
MVNVTGKNGVDNGTWPLDEELEKSLKSYAHKNLSREMRLVYLEKDHGLKIGKERLRQLNRKFNIPSMRKPPDYTLAKALVTEEIAKDVKQRNGPRQLQRNLKMNGHLIPRDTIWKVVQEEAPEGAQLCDPSARKKKKNHGHLQVMQECHNDGHEKLAALALQLGGVGIPIYGIREHTSGSFRHLVVVPNDRNEYAIGHIYLDFVEANGYVIPLQQTVDGGTETGWMNASHCALRRAYLPELDENKFPPVVSLPSTQNISIESGWSYWQKAKGETIRAVIRSGHDRGFFIVGNELHFNLFQWLWPKIVQKHLDEFKVMFNTNATRYQRDKVLPSGVSPEIVYDFPQMYNFKFVDCQVAPEAVEELRKGIPVSREEVFRWVSDEFDLLATKAYEKIGSPQLDCDVGWAIFNKMICILDTSTD